MSPGTAPASEPPPARAGRRLCCSSLAAIAAWQLQARRDREEEARLREIHTLAGTVERHRTSARRRSGRRAGCGCTCPRSTRPSPTGASRSSTCRTGRRSSTARPPSSPARSGRRTRRSERLSKRADRAARRGRGGHGGERRAFEYLPTRDAQRSRRRRRGPLRPHARRGAHALGGREVQDDGRAGRTPASRDPPSAAILSLYVGLRHARRLREDRRALDVRVGGRPPHRPLRRRAARPARAPRIWIDIGTREGDERSDRRASTARGARAARAGARASTCATSRPREPCTTRGRGRSACRRCSSSSPLLEDARSPLRPPLSAPPRAPRSRRPRPPPSSPASCSRPPRGCPGSGRKA